MKVGNYVGEICKNNSDDWYLLEDKVNKIVENSKGKKYYTKSKFRPLYAEDVDSNTDTVEKANGYILVNEVFELNEITRPKAESWIKWANENKDSPKLIFD